MEDINPVTHNLISSFFQFKKLNWNHGPIHGLKKSEFHVLLSIKELTKPGEESVKVSDISKLMQVASPTTTQVINSLEDNGYIERIMDKEDRRSVRIKLTDKGSVIVEKARKDLTDAFDGLVEYLGEENSEKLAELITLVFNYFHEKQKSMS